MSIEQIYDLLKDHENLISVSIMEMDENKNLKMHSKCIDPQISAVYYMHELHNLTNGDMGALIPEDVVDKSVKMISEQGINVETDVEA